MLLTTKRIIKVGDVRFTIPPTGDEITIQLGKNRAKIKAIDLWNVAFVIADDAHKDAIMPVRKTEVMKFKKVFNIQLKEDMKKGDIVRVGWIVDVPQLLAEGMKNAKEDDTDLLTTSIADERKGV